VTVLAESPGQYRADQVPAALSPASLEELARGSQESSLVRRRP